MAVRIPLRSDLKNYSLSVELDGKSYGLDVLWNHVSEAWVLSIRDGAGNLIVSGQRMTLGMPLFKRYADARLPPGVLCVVDTSGADVEAGPDDLGSRVQLLYTSGA